MEVVMKKFVEKTGIIKVPAGLLLQTWKGGE